jgi:ATP-dependent Lon protease
LNEKPIKNNVSITGEIDLKGNITAIGGLDNKILGAMKAGVETIIYPKDNHHEYEKFVETHGDFSDKIKFIEVSKINELFTYVFV